MSRTWLLPKIAALGVAAMALGTAAPAFADIDLGGYTGPITIHYSNYESIYDPTANNGAGGVSNTLAVGDQLFGVLSVASISAGATGPTLWSAGTGSDGYLLGVFTGPTISSINSGVIGFTFSSTTPSIFDIYSSTTPLNAALGTGGYAAAGCAINTLCYEGVTTGGNQLQLALQTTPGVTTDPTVYWAGSTTEETYPNITGSASGDANVIGGLAAYQFNSNGVSTDLPGVFADVYLTTDFCSNGAGSCTPAEGDWTEQSSDPVKGYAVPEPSSLAVLGFALLALGAWGFRQRSDA